MNPIQVWRRQRQMTVAQLSSMVGISLSACYAMESGTATRPHPKFLACLEQLEGAEARREIVRQFYDWRANQSVEILRRQAQA